MIRRLLVIKPIFKHKQKQLALFHPTHQQQHSAIIGHLFADYEPGDYSAYHTYASPRSEGPFKIYVYDEAIPLFRYAYTNYQSKSNDKKCSSRSTYLIIIIHLYTNIVHN